MNKIALIAVLHGLGVLLAVAQMQPGVGAFFTALVLLVLHGAGVYATARMLRRVK